MLGLSEDMESYRRHFRPAVSRCGSDDPLVTVSQTVFQQSRIHSVLKHQVMTPVQCERDRCIELTVLFAQITDRIYQKFYYQAYYYNIIQHVVTCLIVTCLIIIIFLMLRTFLCLPYCPYTCAIHCAYHLTVSSFLHKIVLMLKGQHTLPLYIFIHSRLLYCIFYCIFYVFCTVYCCVLYLSLHCGIVRNDFSIPLYAHM